MIFFLGFRTQRGENKRETWFIFCIHLENILQSVLLAMANCGVGVHLSHPCLHDIVVTGEREELKAANCRVPKMTNLTSLTTSDFFNMKLTGKSPDWREHRACSNHKSTEQVRINECVISIECEFRHNFRQQETAAGWCWWYKMYQSQFYRLYEIELFIFY